MLRFLLPRAVTHMWELSPLDPWRHGETLTQRGEDEDPGPSSKRFKSFEQAMGFRLYRRSTPVLSHSFILNLT